MARIVQFEDDGDFTYLEEMLQRIKRKATSADSRFFEEALVIDRILGYFGSATHHETEPTPEPTKKRTRAPKGTAAPAIQHGCPTHPKYGAARPPRTTCEGCWKAYETYNPANYPIARRRFDYHQSKASGK